MDGGCETELVGEERTELGIEGRFAGSLGRRRWSWFISFGQKLIT